MPKEVGGGRRKFMMTLLCHLRRTDNQVSVFWEEKAISTISFSSTGRVFEVFGGETRKVDNISFEMEIKYLTKKR